MAEKLLIPAARHESRDVGGRFILCAFLLLVSSLGFVGLVTWGIFPNAPHGTTIETTASRFPTPVLQTNPRHDLQAFEQKEARELNSYAWVDRPKGIAHIPIDVAMQKLAQTGIPGWPSGDTK